MNRQDILLVIFIVFISLGFILFIPKHHGNYAKVTYDGKKVMDIDLSINDTYEVEGYNGIVKLEVKDNKIRVIEENSPLHLCKKQGFSNTIVCLPNKVVIEVVSDNSDIDTIVG
ncbi:MAG: NusG domain II-containing protein [Bacilli bacterium]|nr:NusG domain II-containing protein [Bacilli bacterium]